MEKRPFRIQLQNLTCNPHCILYALYYKAQFPYPSSELPEERPVSGTYTRWYLGVIVTTSLSGGWEIASRTCHCHVDFYSNLITSAVSIDERMECIPQRISKEEYVIETWVPIAMFTSNLINNDYLIIVDC